MMYNTNYSARAMLTGCTVFPGGVRELNLIVGGPTPTQLNHQRLRQSLKQYEIDGHRVIDTSDPKQSWHLDQIMFELQLPTENSDQSQSKMETCESVRARASGLPLVTDGNMGEEWR